MLGVPSYPAENEEKQHCTAEPESRASTSVHERLGCDLRFIWIGNVCHRHWVGVMNCIRDASKRHEVHWSRSIRSGLTTLGFSGSRLGTKRPRHPLTNMGARPRLRKRNPARLPAANPCYAASRRRYSASGCCRAAGGSTAIEKPSSSSFAFTVRRPPVNVLYSNGPSAGNWNPTAAPAIAFESYCRELCSRKYRRALP